MKKIPEITLHGEVNDAMVNHAIAKMKIFEQSGISEIRFRLLSFGGFVDAGMRLLSSMKSYQDGGNKIETVNEGMCYSTMGWIYSMGDTRVSWDYSTLLIHNPSKGGEIDENLLKLTNSIVIMLANSCSLSQVQIKKAMAKETTYSAIESEEAGFTDEVLISTRKPKIIKNDYERTYNSIIEFKKERNMNEITNHFQLDFSATSETILNKIVAQEVEFEGKLSEKDSEIETLNQTINDFKQIEIENFVKDLVIKNSIKAEKADSVIELIGKEGLDTVKNIYATLGDINIVPASNIANQVIETPDLTVDQKLALKYNEIKNDAAALTNARNEDTLDSMEIAYTTHFEFVENYKK